MVSLGAILYLVARTLPRVDDRDANVPSLRTHWFMVYLERFDKKFKYYFEKTLRRSGIVVLKLDNMINRKLSKLRKESEKEKEAVFITEEESDKNKEEGKGQI
jgi:hypothetical protein